MIQSPSDETLDLLSAREPRGTAPVRQTTTRPRVSCEKPRDRAKYCSTTDLGSVLHTERDVYIGLTYGLHAGNLG